MIIGNLETGANKRKNVLLKFRRIWVHLFLHLFYQKLIKLDYLEEPSVYQLRLYQDLII